MGELKNKQQLAEAARTIAQSFALVQRSATTFIPVNAETFSPKPPPADSERIWLPLSREDKQSLANSESKILFANDGELRSFDFMLRQLSRPHGQAVETILIRTPEGIKALNKFGDLEDHDGSFTPNYIVPMLNEDKDDKEFVYKTISEWVGGDEEANSLLSHLATALAPHYSAVKYVLFLGEGRNGKSVLLTMLSDLFGRENVSNVSRQMMAERSPTCVELNDKLLNVIFDGEMSYIKDSSMEKTLIAGETGVVRMLYESSSTTVQTNALFVEALNVEPKARDKTSALQKRLVRFRFPNVYQVDKEFFKKMTSERMLGALLSLLIDHYVMESEIAFRLKPTQTSMDLQIEQVWLTSPVLQFIEHLHRNDPNSVKLLKSGRFTVESFLNSFKPWASNQGLHERTDGDIITMLKQSMDLGWKTQRVDGVPKNQRVIKALRPETELALQQMDGFPVEDTDTEGDTE